MIMNRTFIDQFSVPVYLKLIKGYFFPYTIVQGLGGEKDISVMILTVHRSCFVLMNIEILTVKSEEIEFVLIRELPFIYLLCLSCLLGQPDAYLLDKHYHENEKRDCRPENIFLVTVITVLKCYRS